MKKIALVTGGSRGLGKNMAIELAKKGMDVILTYHSNKEEACKVVSEIIELGQKSIALELDTRNVKSFEDFKIKITEYLLKENGNRNFDFLINNAGTALYALFTEVSEEQMDEIYQIHYKGVFFLTQKFLPCIKQGGGIINISSGLTRITMPGSSVYASLKAGVETYTRYLAKELSERKIRVNVVAPGAVETDFGGGRVRDTLEINKQISNVTALGRVGLPDDIGSVVAFLCTDEAYWINGQRLEVSGGQAL
ncbi:SDR family oxidoreductase [uncultured Algoriphagus sp.]|uniref:SDR family NAD(P)-dependent oxidoreductase n=1 Tax=uncultured Algoriphagus sp. TaxID=417365 RepID=UPI0030EE3555